MYARQHYREDRRDVLILAIRSIRFAVLVAGGRADIEAAHVPLIVCETREGLFLEGHVSAANPFWQAAVGSKGLAIFQGPHAYVSPRWLETHPPSGTAVPTWSYVAVHAHGSFEIERNRDWLLAHVQELTAQSEAGRAQPWSVADASSEHIEALLGGIVGLRLKVSRMEGVWKLLQSQPEAVRLAAIEALASAASMSDRAMAAEMQAREDAERQ